MVNEFDNITYQATNNYFSSLSKAGYVSVKKMYNLALLLFLDEFMDEYSDLITEDDYNIIDSIVTCMQGSSCLIPYEKYKLASEPMKGYLANSPYRLDEVTVIRITGDSDLRLSN